MVRRGSCCRWCVVSVRWFFLAAIAWSSINLALAQGVSCIIVDRVELKGVRHLDEAALQRSL
jgi:hypothetical protein